MNVCTTYNVWNVHKFYSFLYKHNLTCTWFTTFSTFHLYFKSGVLESCLLAEHLVNVIRGNCRNTTFNKLAQHYESILAINQLNAQNLLL